MKKLFLVIIICVVVVTIIAFVFNSYMGVPSVSSAETASKYVEVLVRAVRRGDRSQIESLMAKKNGDSRDFIEWAIVQPDLVVECLSHNKRLSSTPSYYLFSYECGGVHGTFKVYQHNKADGEYSDEGVRFEN